MNREALSRFADECQVVAGRVEEQPGAAADLIRHLLARAPRAADARAQAIIDGIGVRMLKHAHARDKGRARPTGTTTAPAGAAATAGGGLAPFGVASALTYIEQRFTDPAIRLSSAAHHAALSPAYLGRQMRASTGLTFMQHLRRLRVQHAERQLLCTMLSIKEISAQCGYNAAGSFIRDFRRVHRCAPRAWRAAHRNSRV